MIFIERNPGEGFLYNQDDLSILAAKEGIIVDKIEKEGIYLNDDFQLINAFSDERKFIGNIDEVRQKHRDMMKYLLSKLQIKRQKIIVALNKFNQFLPKIRVKGRDYYQLSREECDIFVYLYKTKQRLLMKHMPLLEAKKFLSKYISSRDLEISYLKTSVKAKIQRNFEYVTLSSRNFFLKKDEKEIKKMIKRF